ncbi:MAG TPA: hypothetical protein VMC08_05435 [Bacteroidales bacterium]|nr:hypothetical protein [Bacteroidales bacterium]
MKKLFIILLLLISGKVSAQNPDEELIPTHQDDTSLTAFDHLKEGNYISTAAVSITGAGLTVLSYGSLSRNDAVTLVGLSIGAVGFLFSIGSWSELNKARELLVERGKSNKVDEELFRRVCQARVFAAGATIIGLSSSMLVLWGLITESDLIFGLGLGGVVAGSILELYVPLKVSKAMDLYKAGNSTSLRFGATNHGVGIVLNF